MPSLKGKQMFLWSLPPLAMIVGGSFFLSVFMQGKYDAQDRGSRLMSKDDKIGAKSPTKKQKFDLEKEYSVIKRSLSQNLIFVQKMQETLDLDDYVNKRIPQ